MNFLLALSRLILFAVSTMLLIVIVILTDLILGDNRKRSMKMRRLWAQLMVKLLGASIDYRGNAPSSPGLLLGNHRSYFDIIPVFCRVLVMPVGKIEISSWPIIGYGARKTGVLFVDRNDRKQRKTIIEAMREKITAGYFVLNYPEGTTHTEVTTIDFNKGGFRLAARENYLIYPIAVDYYKTEDAWVGDDTFIRHFLECFGKRTTKIKISFGNPISGEDPEVLLQRTRKWIDAQLLQFRREWATES